MLEPKLVMSEEGQNQRRRVAQFRPRRLQAPTIWAFGFPIPFPHRREFDIYGLRSVCPNDRNWLKTWFWLTRCERKMLFWLKKEAGHKVSRTGPMAIAIAMVGRGLALAIAIAACYSFIF